MNFKNKLNNIHIIVTILITLFSYVSCKTKKAQKNETKEEVVVKKNFDKHIKATVTKNELDGCTWIIILDDEKRLEPTNLGEEFKIDSLKIWLQYKVYNGNSICMMGQMVTITDIEKREN